MATASQVADEIIRFCNAHGDFVSNLKLQKLLYYAQAWYIALHGRALFRDDIQAWVHGPVIPGVYRRFRRHGWQPILVGPRDPGLPPRMGAHVKDVMAAYGSFSAFDLERLVHQEEPWKSARVGVAWRQTRRQTA